MPRSRANSTACIVLLLAALCISGTMAAVCPWPHICISISFFAWFLRNCVDATRCLACLSFMVHTCAATSLTMLASCSLSARERGGLFCATFAASSPQTRLALLVGSSCDVTSSRKLLQAAASSSASSGGGSSAAAAAAASAASAAAAAAGKLPFSALNLCLQSELADPANQKGAGCK